MKRQNLLKLAFTMLAMFIMTGAWAQIDITVKEADGTTAAAAATIHTINSSVTPSTLSATIATANGSGVFVAFTPTAGTNYIIQNAAGTQRNAYSTPAAPANITITLRSQFALTIQEYRANNLGDKITRHKAMPLWVYPSPTHNPDWTAPAGAYETEVAIVDAANLKSTFAWTQNAGALGSTSNYVEITPAGDLTAAVTTTSANYVEVLETASAAFGGCAAVNPVGFNFTAINPPYAKITTGIVSTADASPITIGGSTFWQIGKACEGAGALTTDIQLAFDNSNEEYPYYVRLDYKIYKPTLTGTDLTLNAALLAGSFPAGLRPQGMGGGDANLTTNPLQFDSGESYVYGAGAADAKTFATLDGVITVYEFTLSGWNAKISRKSDYIAFRNNGGTNTDVNDANWTWYTNAVIANTFNASNTANFPKVGYIVVFPKPVTGPIYHIPNTWGL
jgi:hypothetical protein